MLLICVSFGRNPLLTRSTPDVKLNKWGYIVADPETGKASKSCVWAGAATDFRAMGAGRKAADSIHQYLTTGW